MANKIYLSLLVLCGMFLQAIGFLSKENFRESSNLHVRKKRVIDKSLYGDMPVSIYHVPYVVKIHRDGITDCTGSILTPYTILTAAHCVDDPVFYVVVSGSSHEQLGPYHTIITKIIHPEYVPKGFPNDLALLLINPPIDFSNSLNRRIILHIGDIPENSSGTISGWGCNEITPYEKRFPDRLRSITVPIISEDFCRQIYRPLLQITDKNICTLDSYGEKKCSTGDSGNPLVIGGRLVGIHSGSGNNPMAPDVFMKVSHPEYRLWILSHMNENAPYPPNQPHSPNRPHSPNQTHFPDRPHLPNRPHYPDRSNPHNPRTLLYDPYTTRSRYHAYFSFK